MYCITISENNQQTVILILLALVLICFTGQFIALVMITAWAKMFEINVCVMQIDVYWTLNESNVRHTWPMLLTGLKTLKSLEYL
jgi:hypothetical protein